MCGFCSWAAYANPVLCPLVSGVDTSVPKGAQGWVCEGVGTVGG